MIVVVDNGEKYTMHEIRFIDVGPSPLQPTVDLILKHTRGRGMGDDADPFVIAVVEAVEWRSPASLMSVSALWERIDEHLCEVGRCRDEEVRALRSSATSRDTWDAAAAAVHARPWSPEECVCTCVSGELLAVAGGGDRG